MKILALIESADHVCYRYRLNAMAWALAEEGLWLEALPVKKGLGRISTLLAGRRAEIVVLQRKLLPAWQLAILRRNAKCLVYDLDDAMFRRDGFTQTKQHSHGRLLRFRRMVRAADAVLAGNDYLTQFASACTDPGRVHYVPTCVEPAWYPLASHRRGGSWARLAWIGQRSMLPSLRAMEEHLTAVGRRLPDVSLRVISDALPQISGLRMELRPWSQANESSELAAADIGISWLCDDLWGQGKCGLKVVQYMAAGLPVVANAVGVHQKMIVAWPRPAFWPIRRRSGPRQFLACRKIRRFASAWAPPPGAASKSTTTSVAGVRWWPSCCGIWSTNSRRVSKASRTVRPTICNRGADKAQSHSINNRGGSVAWKPVLSYNLARPALSAQLQGGL